MNFGLNSWSNLIVYRFKKNENEGSCLWIVDVNVCVAGKKVIYDLYWYYRCNSAVLGLHATENFIVGAGYNQFLYMIDPRTGSGSKRKFHRRPVLCVAADDDFVISGSEDKTISVYDRRANRVFKTIQVFIVTQFE